MEKLVAMAYPQQIISSAFIATTLEATHATMVKQYHDQRIAIVAKLNVLNELIYEQKNWWSQPIKLTETTDHFKTFIRNIEHNFGGGATGYDLINSPAHKEQRHTEIIYSIACYAKGRLTWGNVLLES